MDGVRMTSAGDEDEEGERTTHQFTLQILLDTLDLPAFALILFIVSHYRWFAETVRRTTGNQVQ